MTTTRSNESFICYMEPRWVTTHPNESFVMLRVEDYLL